MHKSNLGWITNDPVAAAKLILADRDYTRAKDEAAGMCLADKIEALRRARANRDAVYADAINTKEQ